ncbi:MAG: cytochrome C [Betaproteobacteria bacterium]|jgi:cytochrome subunit of sulfide dehydrogenase|nr:cytochrome C [Betaproteobacteria bacterium]
MKQPIQAQPRRCAAAGRLVAGLLLATASLAHAQAPAAQSGGADALYLRSLAATCANCHGTEGRAVDGSAVATIAGLPRDYLSTQLKAFKNGTRQATVMHQLAKGYSDAQIEQLAAYFSALKK